MKITVFGANGKVGSLVVAECLARGHLVKAFVYGEHNFVSSPTLKILEGNIYSRRSVENAIAGADCIISTLGSWGTPGKDILTAGMTNIIPSMKQHNVKRIISLTGADANAPGDKINIIHAFGRGMIMIASSKILVDGEEHIRLLAASDLDYTVVRSPIMSGGSSTDYRLSNKRPISLRMIDRPAVAKSIVDLAESNKHSRSCPYLLAR